MFSFLIKDTGDGLGVIEFTKGGIVTNVPLDAIAPEDKKTAFVFCMERLIAAGLVSSDEYRLED
jgi:hypothetical protein